MKYTLLGEEGGAPPILLFFRRPWGFYGRTKRFRFCLGPMFPGPGPRVERVKW